MTIFVLYFRGNVIYIVPKPQIFKLNPEDDRKSLILLTLWSKECGQCWRKLWF